MAIFACIKTTDKVSFFETSLERHENRSQYYFVNKPRHQTTLHVYNTSSNHIVGALITSFNPLYSFEINKRAKTKDQEKNDELF